jgi:predicted DNA-binding transcriptional regulator AlpA
VTETLDPGQEPVKAPRRLVRWDEVLKRDPRSRNHLAREIQKGRFPAPYQLGDRTVAFDEDELNEYYASRPRGLLETIPNTDAGRTPEARAKAEETKRAMRAAATAAAD